MQLTVRSCGAAGTNVNASLLVLVSMSELSSKAERRKGTLPHDTKVQTRLGPQSDKDGEADAGKSGRGSIKRLN